ncbi:hypothetical protein C8R48DRAFT_774734 [Suillus tomentosus]|nr:hypothetical protein C8R48DRAFT_774734 [Suillus tomentosus]
MSSTIPLEIKNQIMTLATRTRSAAAATHLTISQAIHPCIEKLLYEKIVIHGQEDANRFLQCLYQYLMPVEFAQKSVEALFLVGSIEPSTAIEIISLCSGLVSLHLALQNNQFTTDASSLWSTLNGLPLKSLVLTLNMRFEPFLSASHTFTHLSHLKVNRNHFLGEPREMLESIQTLTHLCAVLSPHFADPDVIARLISNAHLRLIAFRVQDSHIDVKEFLEENGICNCRIVLLLAKLPVWGELGQGNMLIWELAEDMTHTALPDNYHQCLSQTQIDNAYTDYLDIPKVPEINQCAATRRPTCVHMGMARTIGLQV